MAPRAMRKLIGVLMLGGLLAGTARAATADAVEAAMKKAVGYLYAQQKNGIWEEEIRNKTGPENDPAGGQYGGMTALAAYSLLAAGEKPSEPRLKQALAFLTTTDDMMGIYALGLRAQVWTLVPHTEEVKKAIRRDYDLLDKAVDPSGRYGYLAGPDRKLIHNSTSQYGVLGIWACVESGEVPGQVGQDYWSQVENGWRACQGADGGWRYLSIPPEKGTSPTQQGFGFAGSSGTMTAAGIATLFITQDYLRSTAGLTCIGNISNPNIDAGLAWMDKNYTPLWADGYFLYGMERIGVASGIKYFNQIDWFQEGAETLVIQQEKDGHWEGSDAGPVANTAFGLLFLARGRAPVAINKLDYKANRPLDPPWNERPRDVANLTRYLARKSEMDLNWQIVNLDSTTEALHEAPLLYLSGNKPLKFTPEDEAKLQRYMERGGILLGHADGGAAAFAKSFRALIARLEPTFETRELPPEHLIYTNQNAQRSSWQVKPRLEGWTNGVREIALLLPTDDPAKYWQTRSHEKEKAPYSEIMTNIFQYSVGKQKPRVKGDSYIAEPDQELLDTENLKMTTVKVARLAYQGNWNPEPGGWVQLANRLFNRQHIRLDVKKVTLGEGNLSEYRFAHLTGTAAVKFDDKQMKEMKDFLDTGGLLLVDAAGGKAEFAASVSGAFTKLKFSMPPPVLSATDVLFTAAKGRSDCSKVQYRTFGRHGAAKNAPRLRALMIDKRKAILFSEEDLSAGLVGNEVDGVYGYEPIWATNLLTNIVLTVVSRP